MGGESLIAGCLFRGEGVLSFLSQALIAPFSGGSMLGLRGPQLPPAGILLLLPFLLLLLLLPPAAPAPHRASYKPVIVVHGLFDSSYSFRHLLEYINEVWQRTLSCGALEASTVAGRENAELKDAPVGLPSSSGSWWWHGESWGTRSLVLAGHNRHVGAGQGVCEGAS